MKLEDIGYLSPSTINLFVRDKSKFIMKITDADTFDGNPSTIRGNVVEEALFKSIVYWDKTTDELIESATARFTEELEKLSGEFTDKKIETERNAIKDYITVGVPHYRKIEERLLDTQGKIELKLDGVRVPIIGYYDIAFDNHIRDLKTTRSIPMGIPHATQRQLAIYSKATGKNAWVDYVSRKNVSSIRITDIDKIIEEVRAICMGIDKFLSISDDIQETAKMFYPNLDSWEWDINSINNAKKIWSIK